MLMNIKCSAMASIKVNLEFDDQSKKERVVSIGDLIDVEFNANGLRKRVEGKVLNISTVGTDPKGWYIIVDGSDDFESKKVRFAPTSILDLEILRKADTVEFIQTPLGYDGVPYLRIIKGRLQYSKDGYRWFPIRFDRRDIIEDAEGLIPETPEVCSGDQIYKDNYDSTNYPDDFNYDNDTIEESNY